MKKMSRRTHTNVLGFLAEYHVRAAVNLADAEYYFALQALD
jgi:hypothetical protein